MERKLKIEDLKKELYIGELGEYFADYDNGYIYDIITQIADNNVDIYTYDLLEWAKDGYQYIENYVDEFGQSEHFDFIGAIRGGQYLYNEQDLYDNLEDALKFYAYDYIEKTLKIDEITEEQNDELLNCFNFDDNNEYLENLVDAINEIFTNEEA